MDTLAPALRLNNDVLLLVFSHSLLSQAGNSHRRAPWTLSHVCQQWRRLMFSSPFLWSKITFLPPWDSDDFLVTKRLMDLQLERSDHCTLDITIDFGGNPQGRWLDANHTSQFYSLVSKIHRCHTLTLRGKPPPEWNLSTEDIEPPVFESLQTLHLDNASWQLWIQESFLKNAPILTRFTLENMTLRQTERIPWGNVRHLILTKCKITAYTILQVLFLAREAVHSLDICEISQHSLYPAQFALSTITLPNLSKLHICLPIPPKMLLSIASHLIAPQLRRIHIEDDHARKPSYSHREDKLSYRCQLDEHINLTQLVLAVNSFKRNGKTFVSLLSTMGSSLKSVSLWILHKENAFAYDVDVILAALKWPSQEDVPMVDGLCPHLHTLELRNLTISGRCLEALVRSRTIESPENTARESTHGLRELGLQNITLKEGTGDLQWLLDLSQRRVLKCSDSSTWVRPSGGRRQPLF